MRRTLLCMLLLLISAGLVRAEPLEKPLLLQRPTVSKTHVAFTFAGDLWIVGREGGEAKRLTSDIGLEFNPIFSPDGSQIAFTGEYDGNLDVYVIPTAGGEPRRLTYHPGVDVAVGWTPDGKSVLFCSGRTSFSRYNKLFTIPIEGGGLPAELPLPMGEEGAFSPDGTRLAYVPYWNRRAVPNAFIAWKHYRGGKASPIWVADLRDSRVEKVPRTDSNDFCPMWFDGKVYFLSDREGAVTLFSYDPASKNVKRELAPNGYDLCSASAGPDAIVFEQFGSLHIYDPQTSKDRPLEVRVTGDFPAARARYEKVGKKIVSAAISPSGARAAFEARGEILTVPAEKGDVRNLTQTPGAVERDPSWSPDGQTLAYLSDESGAYMLHLRDAKGTKPAQRLALADAPSYYYRLAWSPDGKKIAYATNRNSLYYIDVASGKSTKVDSHAFGGGPGFDATWSPDSKWLAYTKMLDNRLRAAFFLDMAGGKSHQITDGMSDVRALAFDKSGKYLFFTASTDIGPTTNGIDMSGMNKPITRTIYLVVLAKDTPSPLAPESDEEKDKSATEHGDKEKNDKGEKDKPKEVKATKIDLDKIGQRILALPLPARDYVSLQVGKPGVLFLAERPNMPMTMQFIGGPGGPGMVIQKFDLETRKSEKFLDGVQFFEAASGGEKVLYRQGEKWFITNVPITIRAGGLGAEMAAMAAMRARTPEVALKTDDLEVYVDPKAEWKQMYHEAWRLQRSFLYDPHFHGYDLDTAEKKYALFLDGIQHRADLNYLFSEMLGHMVLGHTYIGGGDTPEAKRVKGGLLGADYRIENGRYRFARIFSGENWNPETRAPLTQPGVNVNEGDYLLAVSGREIKGTDDIYKFFEATAGKAIVIKVGPKPDGTDARETTVVPVESETSLRHLAWIEGNRRKVDEMTGGKVAYVYLPDTGVGGFTSFNRYFFAQVNKEAVVLDERFNGGGKAADYVIDYLQRGLLNYWTARDGKIYTTPGGAIYGPKVMIINEFAGSGGDAMPWYFRRAKLGPLVGKRTWGGLVGIGGYPQLLDGGSVTAPSFAFFSPDGTWDVENHGVAPDVEVEHDPQLVLAGHDPQLEKAVELVMEALKKNPRPQPKVPEYPNYHQKSK